MRIGFTARIAGSFLVGTLVMIGLVVVSTGTLDRAGGGYGKYRRISAESDRYSRLKLEMQTTRLAAADFFRERSIESRVSFEEHFVKANLLIQQGLADSLAVLDKDMLERIRQAGTGFYLAFQQTVILSSVQDALYTDVLLPHSASRGGSLDGLLQTYRARPDQDLAAVVRSRVGGARTLAAVDSLHLLEEQLEAVVAEQLDRQGLATSQLCDSAVASIQRAQEALGKATDHSIADSRSLLVRLGWGAAVLAGLCGLLSIVGLTRPLRQLTQATRDLRQGRFNSSLPEKEGTELGDLGRDLGEVQRFLSGMMVELRELARDCGAGYLHRRTRVEGLQGEWRDLAESINALLDVLVSRLDSVPQPVVIMGPEYDIRYANPAAGELCGRPAGELQGKACHGLLKLGNCRTAHCGLARVFKDGQGHSSSCGADPAAGHRELDCITQPLKDGQGRVVAAMEILNDRTEIFRSRRRIEQVSQYQAREVERLSDLLRQLADGALTVRYKPERAGEELREIEEDFDRIARSFNGSIEGLQATFSRLRDHAVGIAGSAHGLAGTAGGLAEGTEAIREQSANVAGTTEEISVTVGQIAGTADAISTDMGQVAGEVEQLYQAVRAILDQSREGAQVAGEARRLTDDARHTMEDLGTAAEEIGQVTGIIKRIASQTNLLSLNATIEAVSAGDAGTGFKVVAGEIKSLAQQSANAAEDIERRIGLVQENSASAIRVMEQVSGIVVQIARLVDSISGSMSSQHNTTRELAEAVGRVTEGSRHIAGAIAETAHGTTDVSRRILSVSERTEANSSAADSLRDTSAELDRIARELEELLQCFRLEEADPAERPA